MPAASRKESSMYSRSTSASVTKFGKLEVRIYGDVAIVNGSVIAADGDASA